MNKTVELVKLWGEFEINHPEGNIEDFCRYVLIHKREDSTKRPLAGGVVPWHINGLLLKLIGRINKLNMTYAYTALEGTGLNQIEEFGIMVQILVEKNPKKTEVIYGNLLELSSGSDMLSRLMHRGFIREYADTEDKRSKRLALTPEGQMVVADSIKKVKKLAEMMTMEMSEDDMQLCVKLLQGIDQRFSMLINGHKGKPFEEIYNEVMEGKEKTQ